MIEKFKSYLRININCSEEQIGKILQCFKRRTIKRNEVLFSEGKTCEEIYFVNTGGIRTYYLTKQGQERTRHVALENSFVTALTSFISQQPSFECVEALENSEVYSISYTDFYRLTKEIPGWNSFYLKLLEIAYTQQNEKIENLVTLSAKQRYEKLLNQTPHYLQRLSNKILASYLNMTQETLSRLKSK